MWTYNKQGMKQKKNIQVNTKSHIQHDRKVVLYKHISIEYKSKLSILYICIHD